MREEAYLDWRENELLERLPVVLTAQEAMDVLGVGKNTIYRLLGSGKLRGFRVGRSWRITKDAILELTGL